MLTEHQAAMLAAHREIDVTARSSPLPFISGWETAHDVTYEHLGPLGRRDALRGEAREYNFMADDEELSEKVRRFHRTVDGSFPEDVDVFVGAGSSPLLSSTMLLLAQLGFGEICYAAPIYHAYFQLAEIARLRMTRLGETLSGDADARLLAALPPRRSALVLTDPSWISGRALGAGFFREVAAWQERTGSFVVVDGTFQYTRWPAMAAEDSHLLVPAQTIRLVCPTKSLCVHGVRCAYLLLPGGLTEDLGWIYCKLVAASSIFDLTAAHLLLDQLNSARNNRDLVAVAAARYAGLVAGGLILDPVVEPACTYYAFGRPGFDVRSVLSMNSTYFDVDWPPEFIRINLLSPHLAALRPRAGSLASTSPRP